MKVKYQTVKWLKTNDLEQQKAPFYLSCPFQASSYEDGRLLRFEALLQRRRLPAWKVAVQTRGEVTLRAPAEQEESPWKGFSAAGDGPLWRSGIGSLWSGSGRLGVFHANETQPAARPCSECDSCLGVHDSLKREIEKLTTALHELHDNINKPL